MAALAIEIVFACIFKGYLKDLDVTGPLVKSDS
jgi:hypothetical protein